MVFIKFSFIFLMTFSSLFAQSRFSSKSCLDANFKMKLVQPGPLFGLLKQEFSLEKEGCNIRVRYKKYFPKEWVVDVCREPVHIKVTSATGIDVAKKISECTYINNSKNTSDFCSQYYKLIDVLQDEGLIFAEGDRDDLSSDHGKTYCSYLLIKRYLNDSVLFSRYREDNPNIFEIKEKKLPSVPAPIPAPEQSTVTPEASSLNDEDEKKSPETSRELAPQGEDQLKGDF